MYMHSSIAYTYLRGEAIHYTYTYEEQYIYIYTRGAAIHCTYTYEEQYIYICKRAEIHIHVQETQ